LEGEFVSMSNSVPSALPKRRRLLRGLAFGVGGLVALVLIVIAASYPLMVAMPGRSYAGELAPLENEGRQLAASLRKDVEALSTTLGKRSAETYSKLEAAAGIVEQRFRELGYTVSRQSFTVDGKLFHNIEVEIKGASKPEEIVVIGAHYDSEGSTPGANDNASGTAALLALAQKTARDKPERTLRFVAFSNEEPPYFQTDEMGSVVYAKRCRARRENIVAMVSLETMAYFSDEAGSQAYPPPLNFFYPSKGDFIAFVGNVSSRWLVRRAVSTFRKHAQFPSEGAALPGWLPGVGWSDHWAFWEEGYDGIMVTDTAPFRYPHYHTAEDTSDKLNFEKFARVVLGLLPVVRDLSASALKD
jgi:hypothetical protein